MNRPVQGTYRIEGLIEGTLDDDEQEEQIRRWTEKCQARGFSFHMAVDGNAFSLLADETPKSNPSANTPVDPSLRELLEELLAACLSDNAGELFSTLRSVEYHDGTALQTVYAINATGGLQAHQRTVPAQTSPPPPHSSWRNRLPLIGGAAVLLAGLFLVSLLFVPYGRLVHALARSLTPINLEAVAVHPGAFAEHVKPNGLAQKHRTELVILYLKPSSSFPHTPNQAQKQWTQQSELEQKLMIEALARRRIRCEFRNSENQWIGVQTCDLIPTQAPTENSARAENGNDSDPEQEKPHFALLFQPPRDTASIRLRY
ncbi:MAG: hypothetical protein ACOC0L_00855 [bacterium]